MSCLFCKIVHKEIPSQFLYEDENCIIIKDKYPQSPTHLLVIPKIHVDSLVEIEENQSQLLGSLFMSGTK